MTLSPLVTHNFVEDMALIMAVAAPTTIIFQLLRQPLVVGYLIAGMIVGPHVPGVYADPGRIELVSELGVILLVFSIGLEFKFRRLMRLAPTAGLVALMQIVAMIGLGDLVGRLMGWTPWESLVTGGIVSFSGAVIMAKAFEEAKIDSRVRELVFGVVLSEDVIAIFILGMLVTLAHGGVLSLRALSISVVHLGSFLLVLMVIGMVTVPYGLRWVARLKRPETLLITSMGLCFGFAMIAARAGYSVALGAFLAGSLVAQSGLTTEVEELIKPVRNVFGAIFFVSIGMLIDPQLLANYWRALGVLIAVIIAGKILSVTFLSMVIGERPNTAVKSGFAMAQIGPIWAALIAEAGAGGSTAHNFLYSLAVGVSAITAFLSPYLIRASNPVGDWIDRSLPTPFRRAASQYAEWLGRFRKRPELPNPNTPQGEAE